MLVDTQPVYLVVSSSPELVMAVESSLHDSGRVCVVSSANEAFEAVQGACVPCLVLIDVELTGASTDQVLAGLQDGKDDRRFAIAVLSDRGFPEWKDRLDQGVIDDLFPREMPAIHWRARVEMLMRAFRHLRELEYLREATRRDTDPLTSLSNRGALLSLLFRETDRVQRMNTSLSLMLIEVDDFEYWSDRLRVAAADDLLRQLIGRLQRLLRSYDLFGRIATAAFALGLPGCIPANAVSLAERIRAEVMSVPFQVGGTAVRLTASFAIAPSLGRSPLVVFREAEQALEAARSAGPEAIRTSRNCAEVQDPAEFLSAVSVKDRLTR